MEAHPAPRVREVQSECSMKLWIVPIPGPTKLSYLKDNVQAIDDELPNADLRAIYRALKPWRSSRPVPRESSRSEPVADQSIFEQRLFKRH